MFRILFKERTGLYDHGWHAEDGEYDTVFHWSRANGWCVMATVELLNVLPAEHPRRAEVVHVLKRHLQGLIGYQAPDGLWHNLWRGGPAEREVRLEILRGAERQVLKLSSVDRMKTLKRPSGV